MAYGLAEGFRKSLLRLGKGKRQAVVVGTFGSHFKLNEALDKIKQEGLKYEVEKDHTVIVHLDKNTTQLAEKIRSIIRESFGYVEPQ